MKYMILSGQTPIEESEILFLKVAGLGRGLQDVTLEGWQKTTWPLSE